MTSDHTIKQNHLLKYALRGQSEMLTHCESECRRLAVHVQALTDEVTRLREFARRVYAALGQEPPSTGLGPVDLESLARRLRLPEDGAA